MLLRQIKTYCIGLFLSPLIVGVFTSMSAMAAPEQSLEFELRQTSYLSAPVDENQYNEYSRVRVRYYFYGEDSRTKGKVDFRGLFSVSGEEGQYLVLPELFMTGKFGHLNQLQVTLGRQKFPWSFFDEHWGLGIWQPLFRGDYINPEAQGLTGLFVRIKQDHFQLAGFVSSLFLPDQGPNFVLDNGRMYSANRWFQQPASEAIIAQGVSSVEYEMVYPQVSQVVSQHSLAFWGRLGQIQEGFWAQTAYAYKPVNQLHIAINMEQKYRTDENVALPEIHPMVVYHHVGTAEVGYSGDGVSSWFSMTYEKPIQPELSKSWIQSSLNPTSFLGANLQHSLDDLGIHQTSLTWSYLLKEETLDPEKTSESSGVDSSFSRFLFSEVIGFAAKSLLVDRPSKQISSEVRYLYDIKERGGLLQASLSYKPRYAWTWHLGFDVMGVSDQETGSGFFKQYQGNDRVYGGVSYVF